jgi:hypothetical protein
MIPYRERDAVSKAFLCIFFRAPSKGAFPPGSPLKVLIRERERERDAPFPDPVSSFYQSPR